MASLLVRRLIKEPIGTEVTLTADRKIEGVITASDFETSMEITESSGKAVILLFDVVKSYEVVRSLTEILGSLGEGARIQFSLEDREPDRGGTVVENDGSIMVIKDSKTGKELCVTYDLIRCLIVDFDPARTGTGQGKEADSGTGSGKDSDAQRELEELLRKQKEEEELRSRLQQLEEERKRRREQEAELQRQQQMGQTGGGAGGAGGAAGGVGAGGESAAAAGAAAGLKLISKLCDATPEAPSKRTDPELRALYSGLLKPEKGAIDIGWNKFNAGIKATSPEKQKEGAKKARQDLQARADKGKECSRDLVLLCGCMLHRVNVYDASVFLLADLYENAAHAELLNGRFAVAAAYAGKAMLQMDPERWDNEIKILAVASAKSSDFSALRPLYMHLPPEYQEKVEPLVREAILRMGDRVGCMRPMPEALAELDVLYPDREARKTLVQMMPSEQGEDQQAEENGEPGAGAGAGVGAGEGAGAGAGADAGAEAAAAEPEIPEDPHRKGYISKLLWVNHTGTITSEEGDTYSFGYPDIQDPKLKKKIEACMSSNLDGKVYFVIFLPAEGKAKEIISMGSPLDKARSMITDSPAEGRYQEAFEMCRFASRTPAAGEAMVCMAEIGGACYAATGDRGLAEEAVALYRQLGSPEQENPFDEVHVASCLAAVGDVPKALERLDSALERNRGTVWYRSSLMNKVIQAVKGMAVYGEDLPKETVKQNREVHKKTLQVCNEWERLFKAELKGDAGSRNIYRNIVLPARVVCQCGLDMLEQAEEDLDQLGDGMRLQLLPLVEETRARLQPEEPEAAEEGWGEESLGNGMEPGQGDGGVGAGAGGAGGAGVAGGAQSSELGESPDGAGLDLSAGGAEDGLEADLAGEDLAEAEPEPEEEVIEADPYVDAEGWAGLGLSDGEAAERAMQLLARGKTAAGLAYLKVCSVLNPEGFGGLYRMAAMAANDPMEEPEYSGRALLEEMPERDAGWPGYTDGCRTAAFLRASFVGGLGFDYAVQGFRQELAMPYRMPALMELLDDLAKFRAEAETAPDVYADYRNRNGDQLQEELAELQKRAEHVYGQYVLTAYRDKPNLIRLIESRRLIFAKENRLATLVAAVRDGDSALLEAEREKFAEKFLKGSVIHPRNISMEKIDALIEKYWDIAADNLGMKKQGAVLQGGRRNNVRSAINEMLSVVCQWYVLLEQSAGTTGRTESGEEVYRRMQPGLLEKLIRVAACCSEEEAGDTVEELAGLALVRRTAEELASKLQGTWNPDAETLFYGDFLRGDYVMLDEHFIPELDSTFCALPEFNILARIWRHAEEAGVEAQEHLEQICSREKTRHNYGTADRIVESSRILGTLEELKIPERIGEFRQQAEAQATMKLKSFREFYAMAVNYGQILRSDDFCTNLENTVKYWYLRCQQTGNFGFFNEIVAQAEQQIHTSAQQYETLLGEQLDALVAANEKQFQEHPEFAEAIRGQIQAQNFLVAEDWMHRIRLGDFTMEIQRPKALEYLDQFWHSCPDLFDETADTGTMLSTSLGKRRKRVHNRDTKGGQMLITNWIRSGSRAPAGQIEQILNLLGWHNLTVEPFTLPAAPQTHIYQVTQKPDEMGTTTPRHPIAAFGSGLERDGMYVVCLYGIYTGDRLFTKIQSLDVLNRDKIILVDCALGPMERHVLAMKMKKRANGLQNTYLVIDRVLCAFLAENYNESEVNSMLMATGMPFSYCQPYVAESSHTMPPEIFIGRRDELVKIKQADGVNLIYGGRQLGKSALFKKACFDLDGRQQQRAVFVDIKDLDCRSAALKLSQELVDLAILPENSETEDWAQLCRSIRQRLRSTEEEIKYLLVMLDEADRFIDDCSSEGYRPLVELKGVQQAMPGRFKFVMAGLHNIVRFNRDVALGKNAVITHFPSLKITPFMEQDAQQLLIEPLSYLGFSLTDKVIVSQILANTNYFPGLIQLYCQKLIESVRGSDYGGYDFQKTPPYVVSEDQLRRIMTDRDFVQEVRNKFEITLLLDQDQGSYYSAVGLLFGLLYKLKPEKDRSGYSPEDVQKLAADFSVTPITDLDLEQISTLLQELQDLNILRGVGADTYLFASKNFRSLLGTDDEILEKLSKIGGNQA